MKLRQLFLARFAALALAIALGFSSAQAETLEGTLERGPTHSVLWAVSPGSGDLIGQVFANASQTGQTVLTHCLPGLHCVADGASSVEPPESLTRQLHFSAQPSGWWQITQALNVYMQPSLPMREHQLSTSHGQLTVTDEHLLLFNGRPVLAGSPQPAEPAPQASPAVHTAQLTRLERIRAWWQGLWSQVRGQLLALLGRVPPQAQALVPAPTSAAAAEAVLGNAALHIVAHFKLAAQDITLLQNTGGAACPALYRFATLTPQGIGVTPEFGTCSDIATVTLDQAQSGLPEPLVTMNGARGPFAPEEEQRRAHMQLHRFVLRHGLVQELATRN
ncbi:MULTISPECIES: hypothetical protein [unclassified Acidovorax]|uniref:hypothetical protein n=1 Tax=unclassified Acidovorax TaxID=2684926 RepID=UPI002883353F|nr:MULTISPECIES: hypothetical protein [unclassified Acidovorax]